MIFRLEAVFDRQYRQLQASAVEDRL